MLVGFALTPLYPHRLRPELCEFIPGELNVRKKRNGRSQAKVKPSRIRDRGDEVQVSRVSVRFGNLFMPPQAQARNCLIKFFVSLIGVSIVAAKQSPVTRINRELGQVS